MKLSLDVRPIDEPIIEQHIGSVGRIPIIDAAVGALELKVKELEIKVKELQHTLHQRP